MMIFHEEQDGLSSIGSEPNLYERTRAVCESEEATAEQLREEFLRRVVCF